MGTSRIPPTCSRGFLPGESQGQRSLAGYSPWGCTESHITEQLTHTHTHTHTVARGFEKREPLLQASQRLLNVIHSGGEGGWASVSREVLIPN